MIFGGNIFPQVFQIPRGCVFAAQTESQTESQSHRHHHILDNCASQTAHRSGLIENAKLINHREDRHNPNCPLGECSKNASRSYAHRAGRAAHDARQNISNGGGQNQD